ncbi:GFA family protein [Conservatibacter flavescens]|uniref:Aldehyde-activating protein n=1 Tax=Conservatibacter flavescens TaxID=28161 RepID=A0A2M8S4C9_9PAST|nr:GFA family protein [Conservatibacter flavescens]PJG85987.1 aldehyde-activating protein [Conservatibacter flavescens]
MQGHCLCGAVTLTAHSNKALNACHCGICRKQTGGGAAFSLHSEGIQTTGDEHITHYQSSPWASRAFCKNCGTPLYVHLLGSNDYYVAAGIFDEPDFSLAAQLFIDKKANYYALANDTPKITEAEFLAKVAAKMAQKSE